MKVWKEVRTIEQVIIFIKQQPYIDTKQNEIFSGLSQWLGPKMAPNVNWYPWLPVEGKSKPKSIWLSLIGSMIKFSIMIGILRHSLIFPYKEVITLVLLALSF